MSVVSRGQKAINERYRPMRLSELIGNDKNKAAICKWIESGKKRARVLLFSGQSGCGKTTIARMLAMGLNCEQGDTVEPCLECDSCKSAINGTTMSICEMNMSNTNTKEETREILDQIYMRNIGCRNKVYIFDEVQKLTNASQNALLKVVEQPPEGVHLFFCTTEPEALIAPLRNRCARFDFSLPNKNEIALLLKDIVSQEKFELTDEQKKRFFEHSQGLPYRDILFQFEQFSNGGELVGLVGEDNGESAEIFELAKKIIYKGDFEAFSGFLAEGNNLDFEAFRRLLKSLAGKGIERHGFKNVVESARFYDALTYINERSFYDSSASARTDCIALVWRICADQRKI